MTHRFARWLVLPFLVASACSQADGGPRAEPVLSAPIVLTPADDGGSFYRGSGPGTIDVVASVLDGAALATQVNLSVLLPGGTSPSLVVGGALTGMDADGTRHFRFSIPRDVGDRLDGTAPATLTVEAFWSHAYHVSEPTDLRLDGVPPAVAIAADAAWHGRDETVWVEMFAEDAGSGLGSAGLVGLDGSWSAGSCGFGVCSVALDLAAAPPDVEAPFAFTATVTDRVGNACFRVGSRQVDGKAPSIAALEIFPASGAPGAGQVTFPPARAGTGHDGATFLISDRIHVSATVTGVAGYPFPPTLTLGYPHHWTPIAGLPWSCAGDTCTLEAEIALDDPATGGIHGVTDSLVVTIYAVDWVGNHGSLESAPIAVTRRWWKRKIAGLEITGLSLHPRGDVVVVGTTMNSASTQDTVFGLRREGPFGPDGAGCATDGIRWCYGSADSLGDVPGSAAVGADSGLGAQDARIYLSSSSGRVVALDRDGTKLWAATLPSSQVATSPAVGTFDVTGAGATELAFVGATNGKLAVLREDAAAPGTAVVSSIQLADPLSQSAPLLAGGALFAATTAAAVRLPVTPGGQLGTASAYTESAPSLGGIVDAGGGLLYAATRGYPGTPVLQQFTSASLDRGWTTDPALTARSTADPIVGVGRVYVPADTANHELIEIDTATLASREIYTLGWQPNGTLLGSDGLLYISLDFGQVLVVDPVTNLYRWTDDTGSSAYGGAVAAPVMDCGGHLFVGSGDTVTAYLTGASGMADAPWPRARRDARSSGNTGALRAGIRADGACAE